MQHRIIGPVVLTVHEYEKKDWVIPVLKPGNYSRAPSIAHWEAPGHILTDEQKRTFKRRSLYVSTKNPDGLALQVWPNLSNTQRRVPAAGACAHGAQAGTGDGDVEEVRDGGLRLVGSTL